MAHPAQTGAQWGYTHESKTSLPEGKQTEKSRIGIGFVDDHPVVLAGISSVFAADSRFTVLARGSSSDDAKSIAETLHPHILFMDLTMPGDVLRTITEISQGGRTKVIVFTAVSSIDGAMAALDAGASGFVLKGATCDELFEAVAAVLRGDVFIARQFASRMLIGLRDRQQKALTQPERLNVREQQIVDRLLQAETNREIAVSLAISEKTVKRYMTALMAKFNARNRVEVVIQAQRLAAA